MLPTFAALSGQQLEANDSRDGVNVLPALIENPAVSLREHLILAPRFGKNLSVRKGKWMYIGAQGDGGFGSNPNAHAAGGPGAVGFSGRANSDIENGKIKKTLRLLSSITWRLIWPRQRTCMRSTLKLSGKWKPY